MIEQKEKIYASFILYYAYSNEIPSKLFHQLETWIESSFEYYEIILVNNTTYTQSEIRQRLNPHSKSIFLLDLGGKHLQDHALRAGIEFSKGDSIFIIADSNLPDLVDQLKNMYKQHDSYDIVILNIPYSKWKHRVFLKFILQMSKDYIPQHNALIFLISKRVVNMYSLSNSKIFPITTLFKNTGYTAFEIHYKPQKNKHISLLSKDAYTLYMIIFSDFLPQFAFTITIFCFTISSLGIIYAIIMFLFNKNIVPGWTTLFLLLSFGLSGIFMILSIIIRYLGLLGKEIQNTPVYTVKQITKL